MLTHLLGILGEPQQSMAVTPLEAGSFCSHHHHRRSSISSSLIWSAKQGHTCGLFGCPNWLRHRKVTKQIVGPASQAEFPLKRACNDPVSYLICVINIGKARQGGLCFWRVESEPWLITKSEASQLQQQNAIGSSSSSRKKSN